MQDEIRNPRHGATGLDRRTLLRAGMAGGLAASVGACQTRAAAPPESGGFLWGTAGSAYQTEGNNYASDLWLMEHTEPTAFRTPSGDACNSAYLYRDDIALAASLGFNAHRFSIEWSRIEPEKGQISKAALRYYRDVLQEIRRQGMSPFVTLNHFTLPRWFAAEGGFSRAAGAGLFASYCRIVAEELGEHFDLSATFNEPNLIAQLSWLADYGGIEALFRTAQAAAVEATGNPDWSTFIFSDFRTLTPVMVEAHDRARDAIRRASSGKIRVGVTLAMTDERAAGGPSGRDRKIAELYRPWTQASGDFLGVQNYTYARVGDTADLPPDEGTKVTQMGYPFAPDALGGAVRLAAALTDRPLYVTENGVATEDDRERVAFIDGALRGLGNCLADGIDVRGYFHWSLLDNWEWFHGYRPKFGLVSVDHDTFARTPKPSARHLGAIARMGMKGLVPA